MMNRSSPKSLGVALTIWFALGLSACEDAPAPLSPGEPLLSHSISRLQTAELNQQLAALRQTTAPFHNFERAVEAGFVAITECVADPTQGGQGFHYGLLSRIDATVSLLEPELLMYEPQKNGGLRLVGIEYIIPFSIRPPTAEPPTLFGQQFHQNFRFNVWAFHVWVWRHNPSGIFADWNPKVSCEFAD